MRTFATAALLALAGCYYDRPNPWRTASDQADYEEKIHDDLRLAMLEVWPNPTVAPNPMLDPELDAWSRTVLSTADATTLRHAEEKSKEKIAFLETQIRSLLKTDEHSRKEVLEPVVWNWRTEKVRLKLISERLGARS